MVEHVSDELLAAYLDGNVSIAEAEFVQQQLQFDSSIAEVIDVFNDLQFSAFDDLALSSLNLDLNLEGGVNGMLHQNEAIDNTALVINSDDFANGDFNSPFGISVDESTQLNNLNFDDNSISFF